MQQLMLEEGISFEACNEHGVGRGAERARLQITVGGVRQCQHLISADFDVALWPTAEFELFPRG